MEHQGEGGDGAVGGGSDGRGRGLERGQSGRGRGARSQVTFAEVGQGQGTGIGYEAFVNPHQGTPSEPGQGHRIGLGGEDNTNPHQGTSSELAQGQGNELLPQKRGRGRPRKNPLLPTPTPKCPKIPKPPSIQNAVTPTPAIDLPPSAQISPAIPPIASSMEPLKRKCGRPSKEDLERRAREEAEVLQRLREVFPTMQAPSSSSAQPSLPISTAQQHGFAPKVQPEVQPESPPEGAFKDNPWNSWHPEIFPPSLCNIQDMHVVCEENQKPLVYGCTWPAYTVHYIYHPQIKRPKALRNHAIVINTQVPTETRAQPQINEQP